MWNPLYGTRGGAPFGGACLPKDTEAFMAFCNVYGLEHKMLEATIAVNEQLWASRPAAATPEEIGQVLYMAQQAERSNGVVSLNDDAHYGRAQVYTNGHVNPHHNGTTNGHPINRHDNLAFRQRLRFKGNLSLCCRSTERQTII